MLNTKKTLHFASALYLMQFLDSLELWHILPNCSTSSFSAPEHSLIKCTM